MKYRAVVTREGRATLAAFPDCPGCQTFVNGRADIAAAAREALEGWLEVNLAGDVIPKKPGTIRISKAARILEVGVPMPLAFRLELRWKRAEAKKTQAEFGKLLGMSQQQYANLEGPRSNPTLETVQRIVDRSGVSFLV
jgi:DNA-binding XRE family transcriptional regulator/predicted RNase H-like HicB family nuclease